jgi:hypothetical protein
VNVRGIAAVAAASFCLLGCAPTIYDKPGATSQDFVTDKYACNKDAHQSGGFGNGLAGAIAINQFFEECMNAHGWYAEHK